MRLYVLRAVAMIIVCSSLVSFQARQSDGYGNYYTAIYHVCYFKYAQCVNFCAEWALLGLSDGRVMSQCTRSDRTFVNCCLEVNCEERLEDCLCPLALGSP